MAISDYTKQRLMLLRERLDDYKDNPRLIPKEERVELQMMFSATFKEFEDFADLAMQYLGFVLTPIQRDICKYMQYGPNKRMVQAQRGEAKSTISCFYAIWLEIQDPTTRVLIVSGGGNMAGDISNMITSMIMNWTLLCWLRPDTTKGDRDSSTRFDVHRDLKGVDKSASVTAIGITASLQGLRADLIIADDVETQKNSLTQSNRETLALLTKEFSALSIKGNVLYLGTPQTKDSVYRQLPSRGYDVKVWTGRYPTNDELERYGAGVQIAEIIMDALLADPSLQTGGGIDGTRGQPTDPTHINEELLVDKEYEFGPEGFNLQYMLDTTLADEMRTKIKLSDIPVYQCYTELVPERVVRSNALDHKVPSIPHKESNFSLYYATGVSNEHKTFEEIVASVDPAGSGGDEISYAIGGATNSYIYLLGFGGYRGGTKTENINKVLDRLARNKVQTLYIENNMGHGTVVDLFLAEVNSIKLLLKQQDQDMLDRVYTTGLTLVEYSKYINSLGIIGYYNTTNKERRIIDTISPVTRRGKLVLSYEAIAEDWECCKAHPIGSQLQYSGLYQLGNITYDKGSLVHDDRADACQKIVEVLRKHLSVDEAVLEDKRNHEQAMEFIRNPMGYNSNQLASMGISKRRGRPNIMRRGRR